MKTCPICQREYSVNARYCTRDGTQLQTTAQVKQCNLCERYYPLNVANCPVHGIALSKISDKDLEPIVAIKPVVTAQTTNSANISFISTNSIEAINIVNSNSSGAVATNVNPAGVVSNYPSYPSVVTRELLTNNFGAKNINSKGLQTKRAEYSRRMLPLVGKVMGQAANEHRLVLGLITVMAVFLMSFMVYSLPGVSQQIRAKTAPIPFFNSPASSAPAVEPISENAPELTDGAPQLIQKIKWIPDAKSRPAEPQKTPLATDLIADSEKNNKLSVTTPALPRKPVIEKGSKVTTNLDSLNANNDRSRLPYSSVTTDKLNKEKLDKTATLGNTRSNTAVTLAKAAVNPAVANNTPAAITTDNKTLTTNKSTNATTAKPNIVTATTKANPISESAPPSVEDRVPTRVIARVENKSRRPVEDGYVYQFRLVLREVNGKVVDWRQATAQKINYAGRCRPVNLEIERTAIGNTVYYRATVIMTGRSIEDWYGELQYHLVGVDDEGAPVRLQNSLLLDTSFPVN
jgi:hypothetical protein